MFLLETDRLSIRHLTTADADFMLSLLNDPDWLRFIGDRNVRSLDDAVHYLETRQMESYTRLGFGFYAVELKGRPGPLGICGMTRREYLDDADLGFAFLPAHRGQGYAYEAARSIMKHARERFDLQRLVAIVQEDNVMSASLLEKLGFRFERLVNPPDENTMLKLFSVEV